MEGWGEGEGEGEGRRKEGMMEGRGLDAVREVKMSSMRQF